ncbi:hypothetical protein TSUD_29890 [Trifolium subterraneum]|uniref:Putative plant transposon protein domain-containing protein n=1 Tax=Trifolium subterraneum TaxID=3900 RepID=A0A2Z6NDP7_TRISU|nr:hypothetical protein TSUD_29890 [Trifolium subterraneum]
MSSKRVQKSYVVNSNSDSEDFDFFVNIEDERRFNKSISAKSFQTERGFVFSLKDEELSIPEDFARVITGLGWKRFAKQPSSYNSQWVKEIYSNLTDTNQKRREVVVRGKGILFSEANINKFFNIHVENCSYEATLATISDEELTDVMKSMAMEGTDWMRMKHFASPSFPTNLGEYAQEYMPARELTPDKAGPSTKSEKKKKNKKKEEVKEDKFVGKGSQSGPEGQGHLEKSTATKTNDHAELTMEKSDAGVVAEGSSIPTALLAMTDKGAVKDGEITTDVDPQRSQRS